jgi:hypothetical protein
MEKGINTCRGRSANYEMCSSVVNLDEPCFLSRFAFEVEESAHSDVFVPWVR